MKAVMTTLLFLCLAATIAVAQNTAQVYPAPDKISGKEMEARKSPMMVASLKMGNDYAKIIYSQPHLRGRQMLGKEVAYDKVWRMGANEATELFLNEDLEINGTEISEGAYSLFAIPGADKWTLIVSKALGEWGAYNYDEKKDVARIDAPVKKSDKSYEAFTIWFGADGKSLNFAWGTTMVSYEVEFD